MAHDVMIRVITSRLLSVVAESRAIGGLSHAGIIGRLRGSPPENNDSANMG
jgi:hypothetical protein